MNESQKILLIDDEVDFTELTSTLLRFHDMEVDTLNTSKQIEDVLNQKDYDLIVTDLMMPDIDGFKVIEIIRARAGYEKVPIIVLSAKTLTDDERKVLFQNNIHFWLKPFEPQGLVSEINQLLKPVSS